MVDQNFLAADTHYKHLLLELDGHVERGSEVHDRVCDVLGLVFLHDVSAVLNDDELESALHLRNCQLFVHSFTASQHQLLLRLQIQERVRKSLEPALPVLLRSEQVGAPHVLLESRYFVFNFADLGGH